MKQTVFFTLSLIIALLVFARLLTSERAPGQKATDTPVAASKNAYVSGGDQDHGAASMSLGTSSNESSQKQTPKNTDQNELEAKSIAGYWDYIDPKTGEFVSQPPLEASSLQFPEKLQNALSTSSEGLVEVPSPVAGGGTMMRLNGRFRDAMVATVDAEGRITAPCLTMAPAPMHSNTTNNLKTTSKNEKE